MRLRQIWREEARAKEPRYEQLNAVSRLSSVDYRWRANAFAPIGRLKLRTNSDVLSLAAQ